MSNHILCNIYRNVFPAIMNCDCMTYHLREDCRTAGPGFDNLLLASLRSYHPLSLKDERLQMVLFK